MIAVIDYGVGNLFSLSSSLAYLGLENKVTRSARELDEASHIILPGVGAFGDAMEKLASTGLVPELERQAENGKPLLGICLGMQLLFEKSYEYGEYDGLALLHGSVRPIADVIPKDYKIPHIGWNALRITRETPLFSRIKDGDHVYFVHSYYAADCGDAVIATAEYGAELTAAVGSGNVFGCQFHPEKSGAVGLDILRAFCAIGG